MTHSTLIAAALTLGLASFCGHASAGQAGEPTTRTNAADISLDADRVYSYVDPNTQRVTALVVADDRPAVTISIDRAAQIVHVATSGEKTADVSIADLADAYAQGDAERRAAFLVSMQRDGATAPQAPACDAQDCASLSEREPTVRLASIVRWAVDHVGSSGPIADVADETGDGRPMGVVSDAWQTGTQAGSLLHKAADFWHLWH